MMKPLLVYCYDAYCGWCYGFSNVIKKIAADYKNLLDTEVLSGGLILPAEPKPLRMLASFLHGSYKDVEATTGIKFGNDYLWHIENPDATDWYPDSRTAAIALCIFKEYYPERQVEFATDLSYSLYFEGCDLTDNEAYRHLLAKYHLPEADFYEKLIAKEYAEKAETEFALVKQFGVSGFPAVFIQTGDSRFQTVAIGYTPYETLQKNIEDVLHSMTIFSSC